MSKGGQGEIIFTLVLGVLPPTQIGKIFEIVTSKCNKTQNLGSPCKFEKLVTPLNFNPWTCIALYNMQLVATFY